MTDHECDEAISELYRYLDGELDPASLAHVEAHLRKCSPCLEAYDFEAELRQMIAAKSAEQMPSELRRQILDVLDRLDDSMN
ncbi:MAG: mycothiol system anti-sigma-R factor [Actinomycetes bacterium]